MQEYIKAAKEAVSKSVALAIEQCKAIGEKHCIEPYWIIEQFKQEFNRRTE